MIVVLGAGISDLTLAYYLKKEGREVLLLENKEKAGGKIQSFQERDFIGEYGPNTVLLNNIEFKELLSDLNLLDQMIFADSENAKKRFILFNGKIEQVPTNPISAIKSPLIHFKSIGKMLSALLNSTSNMQKESFANLCRRYFGEEIYQNFIIPIVTGIYAGDPEKMDADYVLPILKEADRKLGSLIKNIKKAQKLKAEATAGKLPKQKMFSFKDGLETLPKTLSTYLGDSLQLNAAVKDINVSEGMYKVNYQKEGKNCTIIADQIVSSIPIHSLIKIKSDFLSKWKDQLNIPYVPICVLHFAYQKKDIGFKEKGFGLLSRPQENVPFLGILFNSRFFPHTAPANTELFTVICGGALNPEIVKKSDEDIIKEVELSIKKILNISVGPILTKISRWDNAIPQYYLGHEEFLATLDKIENENTGFYFTGNYRNGVSVSDCVKNAKHLAQKLISQN